MKIMTLLPEILVVGLLIPVMAASLGYGFEKLVKTKIL